MYFSSNEKKNGPGNIAQWKSIQYSKGLGPILSSTENKLTKKYVRTIQKQSNKTLNHY